MESNRMAVDLSVTIGNVRLKTPVIAGAAGHVIHDEGIRAGLATGRRAVVVEWHSDARRSEDTLERSEYTLLDENWRQVSWNDAAPRSVTLACRSGMSPLPFDQWLEQAARLDREAQAQDAYVVASVILGALDPAVEMARQIEQAG